MTRFMALLVLAATIAVGGPAQAELDDGCDITEQVYGITEAGELVVQPFCARPNLGFLPWRVLAEFGDDVPRLFYGGRLEDATVVIYGVGADGALRWYRQNPATGRLDPGVVVGAQFGDWRAYAHLQTAGSGDLSGVDGQGRLWRWTHLGWRDGTDVWVAGGPREMGMACPGARPVFAGSGGPDNYIGVAELTHDYVLCGYGGQARHASLLPDGVGAATMAAGPGVTYAMRTHDSRLVRLVLDEDVEPALWHVAGVARAGLTAVFTGRSIVVGEPGPPLKYEWQWTWYGEG